MMAFVLLLCASIRRIYFFSSISLCSCTVPFCLFVCLSVCLFACLFVCLFVFCLSECTPPIPRMCGSHCFVVSLLFSARVILPAEDMDICHMGDRYWKMIEHRSSLFGKLAELRSVWWMDVAAVFHGVPPGRYRIQWRLSVTSDAPVVNSEFRVVLFDKDEVRRTILAFVHVVSWHCLTHIMLSFVHGN